MKVVFDEYPNVVLYVREVSASGGVWSDVFLADSRESLHPDVYVAERGQVVLDQETRRVDIVLTNMLTRCSQTPMKCMILSAPSLGWTRIRSSHARDLSVGCASCRCLNCEMRLIG